MADLMSLERLENHNSQFDNLNIKKGEKEIIW